MNKGVLIYLITPVMAALSQILLKKAADDTRYTGIRFYLNWKVILAYALFFGCMLLNVIALRYIDLSLGSLMEAASYLYVMLLSWLILKEKITRRKLIGNALILTGIVLALVIG
ncbi:MAG: EamA family transporter [Clostridia bacterium]|jgi:drug/metabolite transporter (DMT)-like permease|nr:EamA family transporter [Clostridia bacterium]